ncbi:hypothetical protein [Bremerella cremea]|uniref:hypothetical protein n=1 Tax=Bremerella cremea TaxID=1031537 RepID=UPI0031F048B1
MNQRFSITKLFVFVAFAAVTSLIIRQAFIGADWAKAVAILVLGVGLWIGTHMVLGFLALLTSSYEAKSNPARAQSPFATDQPAPQVLPPRANESE